MKSHDPKRISDAQARQYWRAFVYVMQVHENRCIKRAGVAGLRARAMHAEAIVWHATRSNKLYNSFEFFLPSGDY
jgi:hypothetical protein